MPSFGFVRIRDRRQHRQLAQASAARSQKCQTIIKSACSKAGIDLELKSVVSSVFFAGDQANPDPYQKFWTYLRLYGTVEAMANKLAPVQSVWDSPSWAMGYWTREG